MLSVEEAREKILGKTLTTPTERVPIHEALGRILSEDIVSDMDSPPFSNSSMDGFAVIASDLSAANTMAPITLDVVGDAPAGRISESSVKRGEAIRIMTGAPLPDGADSVAPVEITNINPHNAHDQLPEQVQVLAPVNRGDNVRPQGEDFSVGQIIFSRGRKLYPQDIGLLSMLGISKIPVHIQPKIGILSTGDE
ncbi:MAG: molybdopterin molybdotransferase MoeA, partial [Anaerolineae bacterium]|nr:molybdopterin molybdotransferase MoeA [Anaerolineae bacterium]